jgi:hypothetical protein
MTQPSCRQGISFSRWVIELSASRRGCRALRQRASEGGGNPELGEDALDLIQADPITGTVIQLGPVRLSAVRDPLGVLNWVPIPQASGDAGS